MTLYSVSVRFDTFYKIGDYNKARMLGLAQISAVKHDKKGLNRNGLLLIFNPMPIIYCKCHRSITWVM